MFEIFFHGAVNRAGIHLYSQVRNALQICFGSPVGTSLRLEREFNLYRLDESSYHISPQGRVTPVVGLLAKPRRVFHVAS